MSSNLGKNLPASLTKLVNKAMECAHTSKLPLRHGAILFSQSGKHIYETSCNCYGNRICGYDVPSLHAEANCLKPIYNRAGRFGYRYQAGRNKKCREKGSCFLRPSKGETKHFGRSSNRQRSTRRLAALLHVCSSHANLRYL